MRKKEGTFPDTISSEARAIKNKKDVGTALKEEGERRVASSRRGEKRSSFAAGSQREEKNEVRKFKEAVPG